MSDKMEAKMQMQILGEVIVLECKIDAGFIRHENGNLVIVYGKAPEDSNGVMIGDLIDGLKDWLDIEKEDIKGQLESKLPMEKKTDDEKKNFFEKIRIRLREVYFLYGEKDDPKDTQAKLSTEYALWLEVVFPEDSDDVKIEFPITFKSLSFKIWKTNNPKILKDMEISSMKALLDGAANK